MGRGSEETVFQGRRVSEQQVCEKVLSAVTWEMKIKTMTTYHLSPSRMAITEKTQALASMWSTQPLRTVSEKENWCSHYGKQNGLFSKIKEEKSETL